MGHHKGIPNYFKEQGEEEKGRLESLHVDLVEIEAVSGCGLGIL
jgi:hypothetical protein